MSSKIFPKVLVIALLFSLVSTAQAALEINTFFDQILSLESREGILEEYTHLTEEELAQLKEINTLILKNPSLLENVSPLYEINSSISKPKISAVKEATKGFVDVALAREGKVGLVSFSDSAKIDSHFSRDKYFLHSKINLYQPQGRTCLHCGILKGIEVLSQDQEKEMVLLSDGHSTVGSTLPLQAAYSALSQGIKIHTIALGNQADEALLKNISQITGGKFYRIKCLESLKEIYRELAQEISTAVLVSDLSDSMEEEFLVKCIEEGEICQARCLINKIISLLEPLYVTLIILTGFYLIFLSGSPQGRAKAKSALMWLLLSLTFITLTPFILTILFGISHSLSEGILARLPENSEMIFSDLVDYLLGRGSYFITLSETPSLPFLISPYFILGAILVMLNMRYFLLVIFSVLFPFTLLLYPFPPTRWIGRLLLEQTLIWTFSQIGIALVFITLALGINLLPFLTFTIPLGLKLVMELGGLLLLIITPFWMAVKLRGFLP